MVLKVGVISRPDRKESLRLATKICNYLKRKKLEVLLEESLAKFQKKPEKGLKLEGLEADFLIVVGGDGTILRTCAMISDPEIPILGINMGTKGLITEVRPSDAIDAIDRYLKGDYLIEKCIKISSSIGRARLIDALNEVLVIGQHLKMLQFKVSFSGLPPISFAADGLIVSTPMGSTAHSFSAGGAVVSPDLDAFVLTAICPFTPFRPMVIPSTQQIEVRIVKPQLRAAVIVDGMYQRDMTNRDTLKLKKSAHEASFVRFSPTFFQDRLKRKIG